MDAERQMQRNRGRARESGGERDIFDAFMFRPALLITFKKREPQLPEGEIDRYSNRLFALLIAKITLKHALCVCKVIHAYPHTLMNTHLYTH